MDARLSVDDTGGPQVIRGAGYLYVQKEEVGVSDVAETRKGFDHVDEENREKGFPKRSPARPLV